MKEKRLTYAEQADLEQYEREEAVLAESDFATFVENLRTVGPGEVHASWDHHTPKEVRLNPMVAGSAIGAVIFAGFVFAIVMFGNTGMLGPVARAMGLAG